MPLQRTVAFLLALALAPDASATQDQTHGLGGTTTGRVSGVTAEPDNAYAALLNPALLAVGERRHFAFSMSWVGGQMENPRSVVLDSREFRTRTGEPRNGEAAVPGLRTSLWAAGYTHPVRLPFSTFRKAGFGIAVSGPFDQFRRWVALSPYDFTSLRYGAADTQFKGTVGTSLELIPDTLYIGGGLSLFLTSAGVSEASLNSANVTGRMAMDVAFNTATVGGLYGRIGDWGMALVARQRVNPVFNQTFSGLVQVGNADVANQPVTVQSSLYYEPMVIEFDLQKQFEKFKLSAGVGLQQWSDYNPRYLSVVTRDAAGNTRSTRPAITPMQDTLNPRASMEWNGFRHWRLSAGYQYRPTPITDLSNEGNLIDTNTHVLGASVQRYLGNPLFFENLSLSVFGQRHFWEDRTVAKSNAQFIGAPGYTISGGGWVLGASISSEL